MLIPAGVEAFALDAHFQGVLVFQQVVGDLTQRGQILRPVVLAHSALVFSKGYIQKGYIQSPVQ